MSIKYPELKTELAGNHPETGNPYDADKDLAAAEMNLANIPVEKNTTPAEAAEATDADEFNTLSDADRAIWVGVLGWDTINLNSGIGLATAQGMWDTKPITKAALIATRSKLVSRTSQFSWGRAEITGDHVEHARAI